MYFKTLDCGVHHHYNKTTASPDIQHYPLLLDTAADFLIICSAVNVLHHNVACWKYSSRDHMPPFHLPLFPFRTLFLLSCCSVGSSLEGLHRAIITLPLDSVCYVPTFGSGFYFRIMFWCRQGVVDGVLGSAVGQFYFILGDHSMAKLFVLAIMYRLLSFVTECYCEISCRQEFFLLVQYM